MADYRFYFLLEELKKQSKCKDKQVACIIADSEDNIVSVGVNKVNTCGGCTKFGSKEDCDVIHAEMNALHNINEDNIKGNLKAYLSLFPCEQCQLALYGIVDEIIVYGNKHKRLVIPKNIIRTIPDLSSELPNINGVTKQVAIAQGEYAEAITKFSDFFHREHEREISLTDVLEELVDVEIQTSCLLAIAKNNYSEGVYAELCDIEERKLSKIKQALAEGRIKEGSSIHKPLPSK